MRLSPIKGVKEPEILVEYFRPIGKPTKSTNREGVFSILVFYFTAEPDNEYDPTFNLN